MNYAGVDLHKETSWFCILNSQGEKIQSRNIKNNAHDLENYIKEIPKPFTVALESTYNSFEFSSSKRSPTAILPISFHSP